MSKEVGVPSTLYLISYDIKAEDEDAYDRIHKKIQKKLDDIKAKRVLKSQRAVKSTTPIVKLRDEIIGVVSSRDRTLVELFITPFRIGDTTHHGAGLNARLRHL